MVGEIYFMVCIEKIERKVDENYVRILLMIIFRMKNNGLPLGESLKRRVILAELCHLEDY